MKCLTVLVLVACMAAAFALDASDFRLKWKMDLRAKTGLHYHHTTFRVPNAREATDLIHEALNSTVSQKELIPKPSPFFPCDWLVDTMVGDSAYGGFNFVQFAGCPDWFTNVAVPTLEHVTYLVHHVDYINVVINYLIAEHGYKLDIPLMCDPGNALPALPGEPKCESCVSPIDPTKGFPLCIGAYTPLVSFPPSPPSATAPETAPVVQSLRAEGGLTPAYALRGHVMTYHKKVDPKL